MYVYTHMYICIYACVGAYLRKTHTYLTYNTTAISTSINTAYC